MLLFWIIACIGFIVILWPAIAALLAPVCRLVMIIVFFPVEWILKRIRKPKTQEEENKLTVDAAKVATLLLSLLIIGLLAWRGISSI